MNKVDHFLLLRKLRFPFVSEKERESELSRYSDWTTCWKTVESGVDSQQGLLHGVQAVSGAH
jgi:hypothetical protein